MLAIIVARVSPIGPWAVLLVEFPKVHQLAGDILWELRAPLPQDLAIGLGRTLSRLTGLPFRLSVAG